MPMSNEQLFAAFDQLQNRLAQMEARVDSLCESMNKFAADAKAQLELLGFVAAPKDESSNGN